MRTHTRHRRRAILIPTALFACLSLSLAACSDDSDNPDDPSGSSTSDGSGESGDAGQGADDGNGDSAAQESKPPKTRKCTVSVDATGDLEASWEGKGEVQVSYDNADGPTARYSATDGDNRVTVYTADDDIPYAAATFSQGDQAFTTDEGNADKIDVKRTGKGASADLTMRGLKDASLDIVLDFSCGNSGKRNNKS
ncbi:hypothetical protein BH09ACT12_BH09ACT12_19990 [soil metagenome]